MGWRYALDKSPSGGQQRMFCNINPLDGDLCVGYRYPSFEQLGPDGDFLIETYAVSRYAESYG